MPHIPRALRFILLPAAPGDERTHPLPAARVIRRAGDARKSLRAYPLKIIEPLKPREKMIRAIFDEFSIRELILPLDVKSAAPEFISGFDLDSDSPSHVRILDK